MKFNAAWAFMSVKCECAAGHRWDELQGLCVKSSLCYIHSPCFHNGTERCDDIDVEDFKWVVTSLTICTMSPGPFFALF